MFKVELLFSYGWDDAGWVVDDDKPWRFDTTNEAQSEIDDLLETMADAIKRGDMQGPCDKHSDYRVVPA